METQNTPLDRAEKRDRHRSPGGRPMGGLVLVAIGSLLLARQMGVHLPHWLLSWEMIPIGIGLFIGARHSFRFGGWLIPIFIGVAFLIQDEILDFDMRQYFWPIAIISIGLFMILRPRRSRWEKEFVAGAGTETNGGDTLDSSIVFGGVKKNIISKNFQGGRIETLFGGTDLNLMQADFTGTIVINFNIAFGGSKLVVPPQWNVRNEITAILGGIEDKRPLVQDADANKVLVLKGTVMFGGVEIKSH